MIPHQPLSHFRRVDHESLYVNNSLNAALAAIVFEPVSAGTGSLAITGSATSATGGAATIEFQPAGVVVR